MYPRLRWPTLLSALVTLLVSAVALPAAEKPNVVFIIADDLGWRDLGCTGSPHFLTPNIDALAASGMRFTRGYAASSVCSPTRASVVTGKYPARIDLTAWLGGGGGAPAARFLPLEEFTIAEAFKEAGYATGMVGKWHLGPKAYWPKAQGFDVAVGPPHTGSPAGGYHLPNNIDLPGAKKGDYLTDRLGEEGAAFINSRAKADAPFFLYQAFHSVHTPIQGRVDLVKEEQERIAAAPGKKWHASYGAMVRSLDTAVGKLMTALREHELIENTIVVFTSDNGGFSFSRGKANGITDNRPLRRGKGWSYEAGHRVPWLVSHPGTIPEKTTCDHPVVSTDFYPTLLELAGLPSRPKQHLDGISFAALLRDPTAMLDRDTIYWHFPHFSPQGGPPSGALLEGNYKLVETFTTERVELFDLGKDMGEQNDLAASHPELRQRLHDKLKAWRKSVDAKMIPEGGNPPPHALPDGKKPNPPRRSGTAANSSAGLVKYTEAAPDFASLQFAELTKKGDRFELASDRIGTALQQIEPRSNLDLRVDITPNLKMPANGFLVFGASSKEADLVKCGIFVLGKYLAVFEGSYPSKEITRTPFVHKSGATQSASVRCDGKTVTFEIGGTEVKHTLKKPLKEIRYVGYQAVRTRTVFSPVVFGGAEK